MDVSGGLADSALTEIYVNRSYETMIWMKDLGVQWDLNPSFVFKKEGRYYWPSHMTYLQAKGSGEGLIEMLYGIAENREIRILYETSGSSLFTNENGSIGGLIGKGIGGPIKIVAKNVILSCGGFQANPAQRAAYLGKNWDLVKVRGTKYDTGDGFQLALILGAKLTGHWGGCHASIIGEDSPAVEAATSASERYCYIYGIMVNRDGKRFVDEGENVIDYTYAKFGKEIVNQPGSIAFQIFDSKVFNLLRPEYHQANRVEGDSLADLANDLDINEANFLQTIEEFNRSVVNDVKKPFIPYNCDGRRTKGLSPDKSNWAQRIDTPPYRAYAVACGLTMTYGGLATNVKGQVIDTCDRPIEGLFAVGEITGGFFYHNYPGGSGLTRGAVMGRIAGANAARSVR